MARGTRVSKTYPREMFYENNELIISASFKRNMNEKVECVNKRMEGNAIKDEALGCIIMPAGITSKNNKIQ